MPQNSDDLLPTQRQHGRKSAASLAVVAPDIKMQRPEPPETLWGEAAQLWREIVARVRPGTFWQAEPLLVLYCRTLAHERVVARALEGIEIGSKRHFELSRLLRSTTLVASRLAVQLRLTVRSTVDRNTVVKAVPTAKPWEDPDDDPAV